MPRPGQAGAKRGELAVERQAGPLQLFAGLALRFRQCQPCPGTGCFKSFAIGIRRVTGNTTIACSQLRERG